jgi:Tol biopolymer transport system component
VRHTRPRFGRILHLTVGITALSLGGTAVASAQPPINQAPPHHAMAPRVSPDGRRVLFSVDSAGRQQLHVMNADGSNQRKLPPLPIANATWFPDGRRLLTIQAAGRSSPRTVVLVDMDGGSVREIPVQGLVVAAIPLGDTTSIVVGTMEPGANPRTAMPTLRVMGLDGSVLRTIELPSVPGRIAGVHPSRDGRRLAFVAAIRDSADISPLATKSSTIYVMNLDGSGLRAVATFPNFVEQLSWSYDGTKIAAQNDLPHPHDATGRPLDPGDLDGDIVVIDVATGATRELNHAGRKYLDEIPSWSPDGHIYFQSNRDGVMEIYRMNADGSNPQRLTK